MELVPARTMPSTTRLVGDFNDTLFGMDAIYTF